MEGFYLMDDYNPEDTTPNFPARERLTLREVIAFFLVLLAAVAVPVGVLMICGALRCT